MTSGAGHRERNSGARRRGRLVSFAAAVLIIVGGAAVAVGLFGQDQAPQPAASAMTPPAAAAVTTSAAPATSSTTSAAASAGDSGGPAPVPASSTSVAGPPPAVTQNPAAPAPRPVRLRIPDIDVQSELIVLGLNADGTLAVPRPGPDYDKAAWFDGSPAPGAVGPAVIEGHIDSAANGPSVFFNLGALAPGNQIEVDREDGSTAHFTVDAVRSYPKTDFPTLQVYGNTTGPELRLITCGGEFDASQGSYRNNTVVFAHQPA